MGPYNVTRGYTGENAVVVVGGARRDELQLIPAAATGAIIIAAMAIDLLNLVNQGFGDAVRRFHGDFGFCCVGQLNGPPYRPLHWRRGGCTRRSRHQQTMPECPRSRLWRRSDNGIDLGRCHRAAAKDSEIAEHHQHQGGRTGDIDRVPTASGPSGRFPEGSIVGKMILPSKRGLDMACYVHA